MAEDSRKPELIADQPACRWSDSDECATARERSVAGISNLIPACPIHGPHPDMRANPTDDAGPH
jgi:hypothetical protein